MSVNILLLSSHLIGLDAFASTLQHYGATVDPDNASSYYYHESNKFILVSINPIYLEIIRQDLSETEDTITWDRIKQLLEGPPCTSISVMIGRSGGYLLARKLISHLANVWPLCIIDNVGTLHPIDQLPLLTEGGEIRLE